MFGEFNILKANLIPYPENQQEGAATEKKFCDSPLERVYVVEAYLYIWEKFLLIPN